MIDKHPKLFQAKCTKCDKTFVKNCELERHILEHHEYKPFDCGKCGKTFVLKWRLRKHLSGHETKTFCFYFNKDKECPFEKIGCKFRHELLSSSKSKETTSIDQSFPGRTSISDQKTSFLTSTPKKEKQKCGKCREKSQCEDCFLDDYVENYLDERPEALEF